MTSAPARAAGNGLISGAAGHVQHLHSGLELEALDEAFSLADIQFCNFTKVPGHPTGPQALFQFSQNCLPHRPSVCLLKSSREIIREPARVGRTLLSDAFDFVLP